MNCTESDRIREYGLSDAFQKLQEQCLGEIRNGLFNNANFVKSTTEFTITRESGGSRYQEVIPSDQRFVVLSDKEMILNGYSINTKGFYHWDSGKIFLNERTWCIETFYHEMLHSVSLTSVRTDVNATFRDFYEGLTEFYTGYLLGKYYNSCYNNCWKYCSNQRCQFTYAPQTRIWAAFCHCIDIKDTFPIYFYNNSDKWEMLFESFTNTIRKTTNSSFMNVTQNSTKRPSWLAFHQECLKHLGSEYEQVYHSNVSMINLDKIIK